MNRALLLGGICLLVQAVPAFAEKITLACSYDRSQYVTVYLTIDTVAQTIKEQTGTFKAQITDESVSWQTKDGLNTFNRLTGQLNWWMNNFGAVCYPPVCAGPSGPVPCVRGPPIF